MSVTARMDFVKLTRAVVLLGSTLLVTSCGVALTSDERAVASGPMTAAVTTLADSDIDRFGELIPSLSLATTQPNYSLPSGEGILHGSNISYEEYVAAVNKLGYSADYIETQDINITDIKQDMPFAAASELVSEPSRLPVSAAQVVADNLLVVHYRGESCDAVVGGSVQLTKGQAVDLQLYGGRRDAMCLGRRYYFRLTLYISGLQEQSRVTVFGEPVASNSVIPPLLRDLPDLVIWPDALPKYP